MNTFNLYSTALMAWFVSGTAVTDELAEGSFLLRNGANTDRLAQTIPLAPEHSRFRVEAEKPQITFELPKSNAFKPTGNPSIDNMLERDLQRCRRARQSAPERGSNLLFCDDHPGY